MVEVLKTRRDEISFVSWDDVLDAVAGKTLGDEHKKGSWDVSDLLDHLCEVGYGYWFITGGNVMVGLNDVLDALSHYLQEVALEQDTYKGTWVMMVAYIGIIREQMVQADANPWVIIEGS